VLLLLLLLLFVATTTINYAGAYNVLMGHLRLELAGGLLISTLSLPKGVAIFTWFLSCCCCCCCCLLLLLVLGAYNVLMGHLRLELAGGLLFSTLLSLEGCEPVAVAAAAAAAICDDVNNKLCRCVQRVDGPPATGAGWWPADQHSGGC
jgi:hypothetical protein